LSRRSFIRYPLKETSVLRRPVLWNHLTRASGIAAIATLLALDSHSQVGSRTLKRPDFCIGFSAVGGSHSSYGNPDLMNFPTTHLNEGGAWNGSAFTAPLGGYYYFHLSFVRDSYYKGGTPDDVTMQLRLNGNLVGEAVAGESDSQDPAAKRMTGAYSVVLRLVPGNIITVTSSSDGGPPRHLLKYEITGFRLGPAASFSAAGTGHTSLGNPDLLSYQTEVADQANRWNGSTYTVPSDGTYFFSLNFERDSYYNGGTPDDVYMYLNVNGQSVGYAMAGESDSQDPDAKRMTGAYAVALPLQAGDFVTTTTASDGGPQRHLLKYELTGFRVRKPTVFSAAGTGHTSFGNHDLLLFQSAPANGGNHWNGSSFTVPQRGVYYFDLSFVRDSYYNNGTWDDVYMHFTVDGWPVGEAMAGESDSDDPWAKRMTGSYTIALTLGEGQVVTALVSSDGGPQRHLLKYEMTGFMVCAR